MTTINEKTTIVGHTAMPNKVTKFRVMKYSMEEKDVSFKNLVNMKQGEDMFHEYRNNFYNQYQEDIMNDRNMKLCAKSKKNVELCKEKPKRKEKKVFTPILPPNESKTEIFTSPLNDAPISLRSSPKLNISSINSLNMPNPMNKTIFNNNYAKIMRNMNVSANRSRKTVTPGSFKILKHQLNNGNTTTRKRGRKTISPGALKNLMNNIKQNENALNNGSFGLKRLYKSPKNMKNVFNNGSYGLKKLFKSPKTTKNKQKLFKSPKTTKNNRQLSPVASRTRYQVQPVAMRTRRQLRKKNIDIYQ